MNYSAKKISDSYLINALKLQKILPLFFAVIGGNGSLSVVFAPFSYNQVTVGSSTLITLNLNTDIYSNTDTYFVVTDESGNILNEVKYVQGTKSIKISSLMPYTKDRFNFYDIRVSHDVSNAPAIIGYLQIKKGTIYTSTASLPSEPSTTFNLHLGNASFDKLLVSTNMYGYTYKSLADSTNFFTQYRSSTQKLLVEKLQNSQYLYNIFDIPGTTKDFTIDMTKVNKPCLMKTISSPGNNFSLYVYARSTAGDGIRVYSDGSPGYSLGQYSSQYGSIDFYYPSEAFTAGAPYLDVNIYSPATANYTAAKFPDFSKYLGVKSVNLGAVKLTGFDLNQVSNFNEGTLLNHNSSTVFGTTTKQVSQRFN